MDVCKQDDCELYALANATTLCDGELPQSKQYYIQKKMGPHRSKLSNPSVFPSESRNWDHSYITKTKLDTALVIFQGEGRFSVRSV